MTHSNGDVNGIVDKIKQLLPFSDYFQECFPNHFRPSGNSLSPFYSDNHPSLTLHDIWAYSHRDSKKYDIFDIHQLKHGGDFKDALKYFKDRLGLNNGDKPLVAPRSEFTAPKHQVQASLGEPIETYNYVDEDGNHLFQVCRYHPKSFKQRVINFDGSITWKTADVRKVLYRLPELMSAPMDEPILMVEGERDNETGELLGYYTTCAPGGAGPGKWKSLCIKWNIHGPLKDRVVWVICDADSPGRVYGGEIAEGIFGHAKSVKLIDLFPDRNDGSDFTDFCQGKSDEQIKRQLEEIVSGTPEYISEAKPVEPEAPTPQNNSLGLITFRALELMDIEPPRMIVEDLQPEGLTILCGPPKKRKSFFEGQKSLCIARGEPFLGHFPVRRGTVLHLALEDNRSRFRDRIITQSQNVPCPENAFFHNSWPRISRLSKQPCGLDLIHRWLDEQGEAAVHVCIDTLGKLRPPGKNQGQTLYERDYEDLGDLQKLASDYHVGVTVIHHTRKSDSDDDLDLISGSNALAGAADSIIMFKGLRGELDVEIFVTGRDIQEIRGVIQFDTDTQTWAWIGDATELKLTENRREIWDVLKEAKKPLSITEIKDSLGKPFRTVQKTVQRMRSKGELEEATKHRWQLPNFEALDEAIISKKRSET
jgi:hypothetical protein